MKKSELAKILVETEHAKNQKEALAIVQFVKDNLKPSKKCQITITLK